MAQAIDATTRAVLDDEPCFFLGEFNLLSRSGMSQSRYQILRIVRDDRLVTAHVYLGPAKKFEADQFTMLGGVVNADGRGQAVHTVGELREGADRIRTTKPRREQAPSDLTGAFKNYAEEKIRRRSHRSTFGSGVMMVR
jgi:hypothetical protein